MTKLIFVGRWSTTPILVETQDAKGLIRMVPKTLLDIILWDGFVQNSLYTSSINTVVLHNVPHLDRRVAQTFGTAIARHAHIYTLGLLHCTIVGPGLVLLLMAWQQCFPRIFESTCTSKFGNGTRLAIQHCNIATPGKNNNSNATSSVNDENDPTGINGQTTTTTGKETNEKGNFEEDDEDDDNCNLDAIAAAVRWMRLQKLELINVNLHQLPYSSQTFFFSNIQQSPYLQELTLSHNYLGDPAVLQMLCKCLETSTKGTTARIAGLATGTSGGSVRSNINFSSNNSIMDTGLDDEEDDDDDDQGHNKPKATSPPSPMTLCRLRTLALVDCGITDAATVKILATSLFGNMSLTCLDLSWNAFGNAGALHFAKLLSRSMSSSKSKKSSQLQLSELKLEPGCGVTSQRLTDTIHDALRYNNSFFKKMGLNSDITLAILDSVKVVEQFSTEVVRSIVKKKHPEEEDDEAHDDGGGGFVLCHSRK